MNRRGAAATLGGLLLLGLGCHAYTTRPTFPPMAGAPFAELNVTVARATGLVAEALRDDSLPVSRVEPKDGLIETPWFDASTFKPKRGRPLGPNVVQVRAWVDPTKPGSSRVTVETVFRPLADPSLPDRELDRLVPSDHPVGKRMGDLVIDLARTYGTPTDSTKADSTAAAPARAPALYRPRDST